MTTTPLALFVGMPGYELSADEIAFFRETNPFGLFLFRRNLDNPEQIKRLVHQFKEAVGRDDAPVYIDQEGGRVQRLDNGNWPLFRSLGQFGALARKDLETGKRAMRLSTLAMGSMMSPRPSSISPARARMMSSASAPLATIPISSSKWAASSSMPCSRSAPCRS
jgi:beta-N-acetylhexosaminidase